ncbi:hypothetical protein [Streptomyces sp. SAI-149]|uniref:hypothetical protein n=1 Tax=Streptomyces sp. SAI-149 TaxID=2940542 RepID=UPI002474C245|nr:hypothetical protein [Streptomyces sp. SAI-149]MDH6501563.1 DNA-binding transcriptional LysR family regulator [Streptomyces sp. SAI-149]
MQLLSDALRPWREKYPDVRVLEDVRHLPPADALVLLSGDARLVIVGRSRTGEPGTVARDVLRDARGPVVLVSAQGQ